MSPVHWLVHLLGIDTQASWAYDYWSGCGTQLPSLVLAAAWYHRSNCHARRCLRVGKHTHEGTPYCARHRPG